MLFISFFVIWNTNNEWIDVSTSFFKMRYGQYKKREPHTWIWNENKIEKNKQNETKQKQKPNREWFQRSKRRLNDGVTDYFEIRETKKRRENDRGNLELFSNLKWVKHVKWINIHIQSLCLFVFNLYFRKFGSRISEKGLNNRKHHKIERKKSEIVRGFLSSLKIRYQSQTKSNQTKPDQSRYRWQFSVKVWGSRL